MSGGFFKTLFHPFETGVLEPPGVGRRVLFLGAEPGFRLPDGFAADLKLVQGFRPAFLKLQAARHDVSAGADGQGYDAILVLAGRHRGENEARLAEAWKRVKAGGLILAAGGKQDGVDSLRKRVGATVDLDGSLSKHHGVVFWFRKRSGMGALFPGAGGASLVEGRFATAPGMFSADHVDPGSRLLAENLPGDIKGAAADFGAGWGYLAVRVAERARNLATLDLHEADHASLEAARANLARLAPDAPARFFWRDLIGEPAPHRYDLIVMNPPFHAGRAAEPSIGAGMIAVAAKALKPRGRLLLVANRGLPYEKPLAAALPKSGEIVRDASFKVLWGEK